MQEKSHTKTLVNPSLNAAPARWTAPRGLILLPGRPISPLSALLKSSSSQQQRPTENRSSFQIPSCLPCLPNLPCYAALLDSLASFRCHWQSINHTEEPFFVWITNPKSHTKLNLSHFFARGFSTVHTLFLETPYLQRTLPTLMEQRRSVAAIVVDGYPCDRVVLQLARRWLKTPLGQTLVSADALESQSSAHFEKREHPHFESHSSSVVPRMFLMTRTDPQTRGH